jgi:hypothetical protein
MLKKALCCKMSQILAKTIITSVIEVFAQRVGGHHSEGADILKELALIGIESVTLAAILIDGFVGLFAIMRRNDARTPNRSG